MDWVVFFLVCALMQDGWRSWVIGDQVLHRVSTQRGLVFLVGWLGVALLANYLVDRALGGS